MLLILATVLSLVLLISAGGGGGGRRNRCPPVAQIDNGRRTGSRRVGRSIQFTCQRGFGLQGVQNITCLSTKGRPAWSSDSRPICVVIGECCHRR